MTEHRNTTVFSTSPDNYLHHLDSGFRLRKGLAQAADQPVPRLANSVLLHHVSAQLVKIHVAVDGIQQFIVCPKAAQSLTAILLLVVGDLISVWTLARVVGKVTSALSESRIPFRI